MAKVLKCIYKSWPCDDLDQVYGKVNMGCLCIWIGKTVKMSFEGKSQQEIGKWTEYWRFWKKKMAQGLICPCTGVKYHNIQTCLLVYAADLRWAFTGPLVLWFKKLICDREISERQVDNAKVHSYRIRFPAISVRRWVVVAEFSTFYARRRFCAKTSDAI